MFARDTMSALGCRDRPGLGHQRVAESGRLSERILVVDDDALVRRSVERILTRAGYDVVSAIDITEAVRYASRLEIHAALVDYALGNEDGLTLLARLRDVQPSCLRILMTGRTDFPMVVDAVNRGEVMRVVQKPFQASGLLSILSDAFNSARRMAQVANAQKKALEFQERAMLMECLSNPDLLRLAVQPIVSANEGHAVLAYECLLRSNHPVLDGPLPVLRVAERANRLSEIGRCVFRMSVGWLEKIPDNVGLFINLHPNQLADPKQLEKDLEPVVYAADRVTLEITERSRLTDIEHWEASVDLITAAGFALAIDDLGAGYNSLGMLADLQPKFIKLDMSLVRHIHNEPRKQRLVQLMATFADATSANLIAEGVETEDEANALIDCGTHYLQGYFYARPSTEEAPLLTLIQL